MGKLKGKIAVITGGTSGIGRSTAKLFSEEGAEVLILGRDMERGTAIEKEMMSYHGKGRFIQCDVSRKEHIEDAYDFIKKEYHQIDILFNNAGVFITAALDEIKEDDWHRTYATNLDSVMYMTKYFRNIMPFGVIINNASIGGMESYTSGRAQYIYAPSKAAVIKFSKLCALNFAPDIRVNCICPGVIDTEIFTNRDFSRFDGTIPMGRIGNPEDVAKLVAFLSSNDAEYITGAVIPIDGGASLL